MLAGGVVRHSGSAIESQRSRTMPTGDGGNLSSPGAVVERSGTRVLDI